MLSQKLEEITILFDISNQTLYTIFPPFKAAADAGVNFYEFLMS
jgi:hypothetical protein